MLQQAEPLSLSHLLDAEQVLSVYIDGRAGASAAVGAPESAGSVLAGQSAEATG